MTVSRFGVFGAAGVVLAASVPLPASGGEIVACQISAWSTDRDPEGLNVRAGPGTGHPVIATIPPPVVVEEARGDEFAAEVWITGSRHGWFRVKAVVSGGPEIAPGEDAVLFEGEGWVSGSLLGVALEGRRLYSAPSPEADEVVDRSDGGDGYVVMERLYACDGYWAEGEVALRGQTFRGWSNDICASQLTTCP